MGRAINRSGGIGVDILLWLAFCFCHGDAATGPAAAANPPQTKGPKNNAFVKIVDGEFVVGCETFYPAIWNQWEVVESGAGAPVLYGASLPPGVTGPQLITSLMDQAADAGLTVMRTWAASVDSKYSLQTAPGVYNENIFRGLDFALDEASKRNLKVILALIDFWQEGVQKYVDWANDPSLKMSDFFNNTKIKGWYKDWLKTVTGRVNTINGRKYSEDPTIMAWDLINEPRCQNCKPNQIAEWYAEMAAVLKKLDPNHLVTTGEDGFYSSTASRISSNPVFEPDGTPWAHHEGQDFIADHSSKDIDFAVFHMWPDNWQAAREKFVKSWVADHVQDATNILKKPVLLEEFGKWANISKEDVATYYGFTFDAANTFLNNDSSFKGFGFWEWYDRGQVAPASEGGGTGVFGITTADPIWGVITKEMSALTARNGELVAGCVPAVAPTVTRKDCKGTRVHGLPGTGYEGLQCEVDINECVRGSHNCASNATCTNTPGGFQCKCWMGFSGDGTSCVATPELAKLEESYVKDAEQGPVICDVLYPLVAPGIIDDPTEASQKRNLSNGETPGVGNLGAVKSLLECLVACESAPGCSIAVYSSDSLDCYLKGSPSKYALGCSIPPPGSPGARDGPPLPPPAPPAPPPPACTLPKNQCPAQNATFISYYSKLRYNPKSTQWIGNPGAELAPAPAHLRTLVKVAPSLANNVSMASVLGKPVPGSPGEAPAAEGQPPAAASEEPSSAATPKESKLRAPSLTRIPSSSIAG